MATPIRAVLFDFGGVIVRTEFQTPRQRLADHLGVDYDDLVRLVFESETSRTASLGRLSADEHWAAVARRLKRSPSETKIIRDEFFAGDVVDRDLMSFIRALRPRFKTGLISNAWDDLRAWLLRENIDDAFDHIIISAEVGVTKPQAEIYLLALKQLGVSPGEAVFVDDFIENVEGARAVGMLAIHFRDPQSAINELQRLLKMRQGQ